MAHFGSTEWYQKVSAGDVPGYKFVDKWGRHAAIGTTLEPVISDTLAGAFWTPTAASTVRVKAGGDANDDTAGTGARTILVEGLDESYLLASESITLAGASVSSSTTTTFTRVFRAFVTTSGTYGGSNAAEILIENTAGTADIITVDGHAANIGQSLHCQYSAPANTKVYLVHLYYNVDSTKLNDVHVKVTDDISVVSAPFGATRVVAEFEGVNREIQFVPEAPILLNKPGIETPMDIWVSGNVASGSSIVSARFQILLESTDGAF